MSEIPKLCPICGKQVEVGDFSGQHWFIFCECGLEFAPDDVQTWEELIVGWNRRPSGWISVKERLPEEGEHVLTHPYGDVLELYDGLWYTIDRGAYFMIDFVTHWMPLPSAPEVDHE